MEIRSRVDGSCEEEARKMLREMVVPRAKPIRASRLDTGFGRCRATY